MDKNYWFTQRQQENYVDSIRLSRPLEYSQLFRTEKELLDFYWQAVTKIPWDVLEYPWLVGHYSKGIWVDRLVIGFKQMEIFIPTCRRTRDVTLNRSRYTLKRPLFALLLRIIMGFLAAILNGHTTSSPRNGETEVIPGAKVQSM